MSRLLLLVALAAVVFLLFKAFRRRAAKSQVQSGQEDQAEDMVRCSQCGVHLPKPEAIQVDGHYFCSESHRREQHPSSE